MPGQEGPESGAGEAGSQPGAPPGTGAQVGPPLFPCEPQSPFTLHHCLEERPRDCLNLVPVPTPSPGPGARAALLEALWCHLDACGAPVTERDRPSPASQVAQPWLLRGRSPESQAAPRTFSLHPKPGSRRGVRWPLTWSRRRRSSADAEAAAKRSVRSWRPRPCAWASRDPGIPHLLPVTPRPPARWGKHAASAAPPGPARPGSSIPRTWTRCPAPRERVPKEPLSPAGASARALPEGQKQGRPWAPGVRGLEAASQTCTESARGDGPRGWAPTAWWLQMDHVPVPSALQRPQVYVSALPARRRRAVPTSSEALCGLFSLPPPTPFSVFSSSSTLFSALGHSGDGRVLPSIPAEALPFQRQPRSTGTENPTLLKPVSLLSL